ncbi:hypothetical protein S83_038337 [Arachis hypogaea]
MVCIPIRESSVVKFNNYWYIRFNTPISGLFSNVFQIFLVLLQFEDFANHNAIDLGHGHYSLATSKMLDVLLLTGTSGTCDTFGNKYLAHSPEFELKDVEVISFPLSLICSLQQNPNTQVWT